MTDRRWVALLIAAVLGACLPGFAQDLVAPKLLPSPSVLRTEIANRTLALGAVNDQSTQAARPHRHWSKTGKILTIVGGGLIVAGTVALVHGENTQVACSNGTCVDIAWRDTGAVWMAGGAVLVVVGATRRTED